MHRTSLLLAVLLLLLPACSALPADAPPVPDSTMVELLVELRLADARHALPYDVLPGLRDSILTRHGLNEQRFRNAVDYYAEHPEAYLEVYAQVMDRLRDERSAFGNVEAGKLLERTPGDSLGR